MKYTALICLFVVFSCGSDTETVDEQNAEKEENQDSLIEINVDSIPLVNVPMDIEYTDYDNMAFGFGDLEGDSVIMLNIPEGMNGEDVKFAYSSQGKIDLIYLKSQEATPEDNHRQNSYNFKNLAGELYGVKGNPAPEWETLLFAPAEFYQNRNYLEKATPYNSIELSDEDKMSIETDKNRSIKKSQSIGNYAQGSLYFAEFEKKKDSVLVSLVWMDETGNTYLDFPAEYNEMSTWRVDDGGEFDFEYFKIIAVFKSDQGVEILTDWVGAEGSSVNYYLANNGKFEPVKNTYFYSAPL